MKVWLIRSGVHLIQVSDVFYPLTSVGKVQRAQVLQAKPACAVRRAQWLKSASSGVVQSAREVKLESAASVHDGMRAPTGSEAHLQSTASAPTGSEATLQLAASARTGSEANLQNAASAPTVPEANLQNAASAPTVSEANLQSPASAPTGSEADLQSSASALTGSEAAQSIDAIDERNHLFYPRGMNFPEPIEARLHELPSKRRRTVVNGLHQLAAELLTLSALTEDLKKLEAASRAAADFVELLMTVDSRQLTRLARLLTDLRGEIDAEEMSIEELEASGRLQVLALYREIEEESFTVAELERAGIQRQRLKQLRDQGRLLGIQLPFQRGYLYPRWQFGSDVRVKDFLPEILAAAQETGWDAISVHRFMTRPQADRSPTPLELCEQGQVEPALSALRTAGELDG